MSRMVELLEKAAQSLEKGEDPFHNSFLAKNDVTIYEAYDLADLLAVGARMVIFMTEQPEATAAALNGAALVLSRKKLEQVTAAFKTAKEKTDG